MEREGALGTEDLNGVNELPYSFFCIYSYFLRGGSEIALRREWCLLHLLSSSGLSLNHGISVAMRFEERQYLVHMTVVSKW